MDSGVSSENIPKTAAALISPPPLPLPPPFRPVLTTQSRVPPSAEGGAIFRATEVPPVTLSALLDDGTTYSPKDHNGHSSSSSAAFMLIVGLLVMVSLFAWHSRRRWEDKRNELLLRNVLVERREKKEKMAVVDAVSCSALRE